MRYEVPDEYYFRLHHVRPRFKDDLENVLIYMSTEISKIPQQDRNDFNTYFTEAIRQFPGNAVKSDKTIANWRTEICALFGFYHDDGNIAYPGRRAKELAEKNDLAKFFKTFLYSFQYPGGHIKPKEIHAQMQVGIHFKPAQYLLKVLRIGQDQNHGKRVGISKAEFCHCVFNDLRCTRDNEDPAVTWNRIVINRQNDAEYDKTGDVVRYAGDIIDYLEYANLLVTYNGAEYYLNKFEAEAIMKFINSTEWFNGYDCETEHRHAKLSDINMQKESWFDYVNRDLAGTDFSTDVFSFIAQDQDDEETAKLQDISHKDFLERLGSSNGVKPKDIGDMGEALIYSHECKKIKDAGGDEDLIHLVKRIPTSLAVGYDIQSIDFMRKKKYIEVKTTISMKPLHFNKVHLTSNEWNTASTVKENYYVYRLMISKKERKLFILQDPVNLYKNDRIDMALSVAPGADIMFNTQTVGQFEELLSWGN